MFLAIFLAPLSEFWEVLGACAKGLQWVVALEIFSFEADATAFASLLSACSWRVAWQLLSEADDRSVAVVAYNALIGTCCKARCWRQALLLFEKAIEDVNRPTEPRRREPKSLEPEVVSFNSALDACVLGVRWALALQLLGSMEGFALQPVAWLVGKQA